MPRMFFYLTMNSFLLMKTVHINRKSNGKMEKEVLPEVA